MRIAQIVSFVWSALLCSHSKIHQKLCIPPKTIQFLWHSAHDSYVFHLNHIRSMPSSGSMVINVSWTPIVMDVLSFGGIFNFVIYIHALGSCIYSVFFVNAHDGWLIHTEYSTWCNVHVALSYRKPQFIFNQFNGIFSVEKTHQHSRRREHFFGQM